MACRLDEPAPTKQQPFAVVTRPDSAPSRAHDRRDH